MLSSNTVRGSPWLTCAVNQPSGWRMPWVRGVLSRLKQTFSSGAAVRAAVAKTKQTFGIPHIVVNNAGFTHRNRPLLEVDEATFDKTFAVNVKSIYHMVSAAAEAMRDNGGGSDAEYRLGCGHASPARPVHGIALQKEPPTCFPRRWL